MRGPDPTSLSPLTLAYVGDAVYELHVRTRLLAGGISRPAQLHARATSLVRATAQAEAARAVEGFLTDEERAVLRRGRNAKPGHPPRGADRADYHTSTGLESLIGFLYLSGRDERLQSVLALIDSVAGLPPATPD